MELRQLRYFVTVAELRHFGRAADQLRIVQPAVSQQVARLERELGLQLFDRSHRQIALTADGEAFLPYAHRVLDAVGRAGRAAADLAAGTSGVLRVGSSEGLGVHLEDILTAFRERRPAATVTLSTGTTPAKLDAVAAGQLDAAFVRAAAPTGGVTTHWLWDEPLVLAVPADRAPVQPAPLDLASLADLPLTQRPRATNPGVYDAIRHACHQAGFEPTPGPTLGSLQDQLAVAVAAGRCWTLLYASTTIGAGSRVALVPPLTPVLIPTGLAVNDREGQPLCGEFLKAALAERHDDPG